MGTYKQLDEEMRTDLMNLSRSIKELGATISSLEMDISKLFEHLKILPPLYETIEVIESPNIVIELRDRVEAQRKYIKQTQKHIYKLLKVI